MKRFLSLFLATSVVVSSAQAGVLSVAQAKDFVNNTFVSIPRNARLVLSAVQEQALVKKFLALEAHQKIALAGVGAAGLVGLCYVVHNKYPSAQKREAQAQKLYADAQKRYDNDEGFFLEFGLKDFCFSDGDIVALSIKATSCSAYPLVSFFNRVSYARGSMHQALRDIEKALKLSADELLVKKCTTLKFKLYDGIVIFDKVITLLQANPAWAQQYALYKRECRNAFIVSMLRDRSSETHCPLCPYRYGKLPAIFCAHCSCCKTCTHCHGKQKVASSNFYQGNYNGTSHKQEVPDSMPDWYF